MDILLPDSILHIPPSILWHGIISDQVMIAWVNVFPSHSTRVAQTLSNHESSLLANDAAVGGGTGQFCSLPCGQDINKYYE